MAGGARSNSWNLAPVADVSRAPGAACPLASDAERLAAVMNAVPPERLAFLRLKDRMRLFASATRDFTDAELARAKVLGQLYLDISRKHAPDDFSADLRKLVLERECSSCQLEPHCAGCYGAQAADVFARDERRVREILRGLRGGILDVGAGHAPYAGELEGSVRGGGARYLAVDPDASRLALLQSRLPWVQLRVGTLEEVAREGLSFRHVLFLRSFNHLPDPERTLAAAIALLEPDGTLLLVDDVAFGLVRTREQADRAEAGPATFEHYRNEASAEAHERIERLGLVLLERQDVTPSGSNQWLLRYRKPSLAR